MKNSKIGIIHNRTWLLVIPVLALLCGCAHEELISNQARVNLKFSIIKPVASSASQLKMYLYNSQGKLYGTYPCDTVNSLTLDLPFDTYKFVTCNSDAANTSFSGGETVGTLQANLGETKSVTTYTPPGWLYGTNERSFVLTPAGLNDKYILKPFTKILNIYFKIDPNSKISIAPQTAYISNANATFDMSTGKAVTSSAGQLNYLLKGGINYTETFLFWGAANTSVPCNLSFPVLYSGGTVKYCTADLSEAIKKVDESLTVAIQIDIVPETSYVKATVSVIPWSNAGNAGGNINVF